ncbi:MAG TPA: serine dehydratase subunit alpha family protein, partial [Clostridia bacterium]|nr:serine dehydratase subunit alpha family protein [Clostridia bacterium]
MDKIKLLKILEKELVVALGCTEPVSFAYAAALARRYAPSGEIATITVKGSVNMIKNAAGVIIPGTDLNGVDLAAVLGALIGDPDKKLEVLEGVTAAAIAEAQALISSGRVKILVADTPKKLLVEVSLVNTEGEEVDVTIADEHTRVVKIVKNGKVIFSIQKERTGEEENLSAPDFSLEDIWEFIKTADPVQDLQLVQRSIELNTHIGRQGLEGNYGLKIGKTIKEGIAKSFYTDDLVYWAAALTSAASDARMAGCPTPVMSNTGSGNQGITATVPVVAVGEKLGADREQILRAVALSHLVTIYIKYCFGRLSALCGATVASTGASCGIVYLLGGSLEQVKGAIQNMLGNVTGMLCDGAKIG